MSTILIVSKISTHETRAGNQYAVLSQAEILKQLGNEVHFLYVQELPLRKNNGSYLSDLESTKRYWKEHFHLYTVSRVEKLRMNLYDKFDRAFLNDYHKVDEYYPSGLTNFVRKLNEQYKFDVCIVNYIKLSKLFEFVKFPKMAVHTHDSFAYRELKVNEKCSSMNASEEAKGLQRCDSILALQDNEAIYFKMLSPHSNVYTIYSKYDYRSQPIAGNHNLLFLSGSNGYNVNGLNWFVREIYPYIKERFPDVNLIVGGSICKVVEHLNKVDGIRLLGFVDDLSDFYKQGDVAINPVYQGTGLKIKTFESLSFDKVTLAHPHSIDGIYDVKNAPIFASTDPQAWISYLVNVWENQQFIYQIKKRNEQYMKSMSDCIIEEYRRFLND